MRVSDKTKAIDWVEKVNEIMDWFDFGKVAKVVEALKWTYEDPETKEDYIPIEGELRESARKTLNRSIDSFNDRPTDGTKEMNERDSTISTGGFTATASYDGELVLTFNVDEWSTRD